MYTLKQKYYITITRYVKLSDNFMTKLFIGYLLYSFILFNLYLEHDNDGETYCSKS